MEKPKRPLGLRKKSEKGFNKQLNKMLDSYRKSMKDNMLKDMPSMKTKVFNVTNDKGKEMTLKVNIPEKRLKINGKY
jgi:hypothetical protein